MKYPETIKYQSGSYLTTRQLAELFEVEPKIMSRNFQRNAHRYQLRQHYIVLQGEELKQFKKSSEQSEILKYVSHLYLWTKEGAVLLAKSGSSDSTWAALDSKLEEVYSVK